MANRFYTNIKDLLSGQRARASDVEAGFDAVSSGLDLVEGELDLSLKAPIGTVGDMTLPAVRQDKVLGFDGAGLPVAVDYAYAIDDATPSASTGYSGNKIEADFSPLSQPEFTDDVGIAGELRLRGAESNIGNVFVGEPPADGEWAISVVDLSPGINIPVSHIGVKMDGTGLLAEGIFLNVDNASSPVDVDSGLYVKDTAVNFNGKPLATGEQVGLDIAAAVLPPASTGAEGGLFTYALNDQTGPFDFSSLLSPGAFESFGPTSSNATNIIPQLDTTLPAGAKTAMFSVSMTEDATAAITTPKILQTRVTGSVLSGGTRVSFEHGVTPVSGRVQSMGVFHVVLDANLTFEMAVSSVTNLTSVSSHMRLIGFTK